MSKIIINTDSSVPNYCALEGAGRFMLDNYAARVYKNSREIIVSSKRTVLVEEK